MFDHIRRALVVDDEPMLRLNLTSLLADMGIKARDSAGTGLTATIEAFRPDLILLDVRLVASDAFAVLRDEIPSGFPGVVSIVSGTSLDVVMDVMLFGEKRGLRMGPPILKPFDQNDVQSVAAAADDLLRRRTICEDARTQEAGQVARTALSLRDALDGGLLEVWYQPKFATSTGQISGAEALIRARLDGQVVMPATLLQGAGRQDMLDLTDFVLRDVAGRLDALAAAGFRKRLSVNVPVSYLLQPDPPRLLREAGAKPNWPGMIFEITEDEALSDAVDMVMVATQLKLYAIQLSIDDFGAGYSSLARLRDLPFGEIKIDRSFVQGCATDSRKYTICRSILSLGAELGAVTVAEGIDNEADMDVCARLGATQMQGFHLAKPMPYEAFLGLVTREEPPMGLVAYG